jgi:dTDP-4-dehydrorhamnose 3,5-epimerase
MIFHRSKLAGAWLIEPERRHDERGHFVRTFCVEEFEMQGLESKFVQTSLSFNKLKGTLRGLHFQRAPHQETKVVGCVQGAIYDVLVDLRAGSPTFGQWEGYELSQENGRQLYIPEGFAHGFQTLSDASTVSYAISRFHAPDAASGVRFDDRQLDVKWPQPPLVISERDLSWPYLAAR